MRGFADLGAMSQTCGKDQHADTVGIEPASDTRSIVPRRFGENPNLVMVAHSAPREESRAVLGAETHAVSSGSVATNGARTSRAFSRVCSPPRRMAGCPAPLTIPISSTPATNGVLAPATAPAVGAPVSPQEQNSILRSAHGFSEWTQPHVFANGGVWTQLAQDAHEAGLRAKCMNTHQEVERAMSDLAVLQARLDVAKYIEAATSSPKASIPLASEHMPVNACKPPPTRLASDMQRPTVAPSLASTSGHGMSPAIIANAARAATSMVVAQVEPASPMRYLQVVPSSGASTIQRRPALASPTAHATSRQFSPHSAAAGRVTGMVASPAVAPSGGAWISSGVSACSRARTLSTPRHLVDRAHASGSHMVPVAGSAIVPLPVTGAASGAVQSMPPSVAQVRSGGAGSPLLTELNSDCPIEKIVDSTAAELLQQLPPTLKAIGWTPILLKRHLWDLIVEAAGTGGIRGAVHVEKTLLVALHSATAWMALERSLRHACTEASVRESLVEEMLAALRRTLGLDASACSGSVTAGYRGDSLDDSLAREHAPSAISDDGTASLRTGSALSSPKRRQGNGFWRVDSAPALALPNADRRAKEELASELVNMVHRSLGLDTPPNAVNGLGRGGDSFHSVENASLRAKGTENGMIKKGGELSSLSARSKGAGHWLEESTISSRRGLFDERRTETPRSAARSRSMPALPRMRGHEQRGSARAANRATGGETGLSSLADERRRRRSQPVRLSVRPSSLRSSVGQMRHSSSATGLPSASGKAASSGNTSQSGSRGAGDILSRLGSSDRMPLRARSSSLRRGGHTARSSVASLYGHGEDGSALSERRHRRTNG